MKLSEMSIMTAKRTNKVLESRFGFSLDFDNLTVDKAKKLSETITTNLNKIRHSVDAHLAEKNPRYMELLTVKEGISRWLEENSQVVEEETAEVITEGEVGNAEVLLAAKNMVDEVQDMIETAGKMQNEQLPQLLDTIRDQVGSEYAEGYANAVGATLDQLMPALQAARDGVDSGVRILTGEQVDQPMDMPADEELPAPEPESDLDVEEPDEFGATDSATGGTQELGRELR